MAQTVFANGRGVDHKGSSGMSPVFPDVCKVPAPPAPPIPTPFPNIGMCQQAKKTTKKVKVKNKKCLTKKSEIPRTSGDEAGTLKGMISNTNMDKLKYKKSSSKVKFEGAKVVRSLDMTGHNGSNQNAPPGAQIAPSQTKVIVEG